MRRVKRQHPLKLRHRFCIVRLRQKNQPESVNRLHICCIVSDDDFVVRFGFDIRLFFPIHFGKRAMQRRRIRRKL